jgi:hypothetical protein
MKKLQYRGTQTNSNRGKLQIRGIPIVGNSNFNREKLQIRGTPI